MFGEESIESLDGGFRERLRPASIDEKGNVTEVKITSASMTRLALPILACFLLVFLWALGVRLAKEWPRVKAGQGAGAFFPFSFTRTGRFSPASGWLCAVVVVQ